MSKLDLVRRQNISMRNRQFLTSYDWEFNIDFTNYKFYAPPMDSIFLQTKQLNLSQTDLDHSLIETTVRGHKIIQPGWTKNEGGTVTLDLADFEDQTMKYWFLDWTNKMDSLTTHVGYHRNDLMVDMYVWRLNQNHQRVWQYQCINGLPDDTDSDSKDFATDKREAIGENSKLTIKFETIIPTPYTIPSA